MVFSWIAWPSKEVRDEAQRKLRDDPRVLQDMLFDATRMIYGGFVPIFDFDKLAR